MTKKFFHPDELTHIRQSCDWRRVLDALGVRADVKRCTESEFWGFSPFNPEERTASFHMKEPGIWYDWSTHAVAPGRTKPGGGIIEFVQAVHATRGQILKLNEAASWLVDGGYCRSAGAVDVKAPPISAVKEEVKVNRPIDLDLTPRLIGQGTHPQFTERGISAATCRYLRCGFYPSKRGALAERIVFQVGRVNEKTGKREILTHIGRATTREQEEERGKWRFYKGFNPSLELYNLDNVLLDPVARKQVKDTGRIILVEGAFDVAKCVEAGIRNVVATFGARLSRSQAERVRMTLVRLGASKALVFFDHDEAGRAGVLDAVPLLEKLGVVATSFDWRQQFGDQAVADPCGLTAEQLAWMRKSDIL